MRLARAEAMEVGRLDAMSGVVGSNPTIGVYKERISTCSP